MISAAISWAVMGLIVGALAKWIMPGKDPGGVLVTMLIGIAGALIGGVIGRALDIVPDGNWSFWGLVLATAGGLILLFLYRKFSGSKAA